MPLQFSTVGLITRTIKENVVQTLDALHEYLQTHSVEIIVEENTGKAMASSNLRLVPREKFAELADLVIVIGGDGSLLHAAHLVVDNKTPILGINRGRLGFLTDINPAAIEKIADVLKGKYKEEPRVMLHTRIAHQNKNAWDGDALNEVALLPGEVSHMVEFEIYIENQFVCSQRADGLIIATPTGSTAYSLSGGGPIMHPGLNAVVLVPMFPHTLTSRPLVISNDCEIKITVSKDSPSLPSISCDGQEREPVERGTNIYINKKPQCLRLIHPLDYSYYETLRTKLRWGTKL